MGSHFPESLHSLEMPASWGSIGITFSFDVRDLWTNDGSGPFIDDLRVMDGSTCGAPTTYCDAIANSTGQAAHMASAGSTSIVANDLELRVSGCLPNQAGIFFYPEVGDEVILGFINDNPDDPIILGSLYNGNSKNPPFSPDEDNSNKAFLTASTWL